MKKRIEDAKIGRGLLGGLGFQEKKKGTHELKQTNKRKHLKFRQSKGWVKDRKTKFTNRYTSDPSLQKCFQLYG